MTDRSNRHEVRNPVLALPAARRLLEQETFTRQDLVDILNDLARDAAARGEKSWRQNKGPMAAYWKATGAYAKHFKNVLRMAQRAAARRPHPQLHLVAAPAAAA